MATSEHNSQRISQGKQKIYKLENEVLYNKAMVILTRESILENRAAILKNYEAAFNGNRQLANSNTETAFRNRYFLIKNTEASDPVHVNFREITANKAKLDFLDHRSKLNSQVTKLSEEMAEINAKLIALNKEIMKVTGDIVDFNKKTITENSDLIKNGIHGWDAATPESNAKLIDANFALAGEIAARAASNVEGNQKVYDHVKANRTHIEENTVIIYKRRSEILANRANIDKNISDAIKLIH